jgi:hypothetical protein
MCGNFNTPQYYPVCPQTVTYYVMFLATCGCENFLLFIFRIEGCNVMDSKMRPLWMVFENDDEMGAPTTLIFKNGDGEFLGLFIFS